jgi:hypothetical protein
MTEPNSHTKYKLHFKLKAVADSPTELFPLTVDYKHGDTATATTVSANDTSVTQSAGGWRFSDVLLAKEDFRFSKKDIITLNVNAAVRARPYQLMK